MPIQKVAEKERPPRKKRCRRWLLVLLIGILICVPVGWKVDVRTYSSTGMLQVKASTGPIIGTASSDVPMFEPFVKSQIVLLKNERTLDMAIAEASESLAWQRQGKRNTPSEMDTFQESLAIERDGEIISVTFTDRDPDVAMEAVKSVLDAYSRLYLEDASKTSSETTQTVTNLRESYLKRLKELNDKINDITGNMGIETVQARYQSYIAQMIEAERDWHRAKDQLEEYMASHPGAVIPLETPALTTAPAAAPPVTKPADTPVIAPELSGHLTRERLARKQYAETSEEVLKLGKVVEEVNSVNIDFNIVKSLLEACKNKLEQMKLDDNTNRVTIISTGDRPVEHRTHRWLQFPAAFAILYLTLTLLIALTRRITRPKPDYPKLINPFATDSK